MYRWHTLYVSLFNHATCGTAYPTTDDDLMMCEKFYLKDMCIVTLMPGGSPTICGDNVWYAYSNGIIYNSTHTRFMSATSLGASTGSFFTYKHDRMTPTSIIQAVETSDEVRMFFTHSNSVLSNLDS